jgi:hypothetical protein
MSPTADPAQGEHGTLPQDEPHHPGARFAPNATRMPTSRRSTAFTTEKIAAFQPIGPRVASTTHHGIPLRPRLDWHQRLRL